MQTLHREVRRIARDLTEVRKAPGCCRNHYQFVDGSVGYFAPDSPPLKEYADAQRERTQFTQMMAEGTREKPSPAD